MSAGVTDDQIVAALAAGEDASVQSHIAIADLCKLVRILSQDLQRARAETTTLRATIVELERRPGVLSRKNKG